MLRYSSAGGFHLLLAAFLPVELFRRLGFIADIELAPSLINTSSIMRSWISSKGISALHLLQKVSMVATRQILNL